MKAKGIIKEAMLLRNQPSDEAMIKVMEFLMKTSVPRLLKAKEQRSISDEMSEKITKDIPNC